MPCRICRTDTLELIHDFGTYPVISFGDKDNVAPLVLTICSTCHLVQLRDTINPDSVFRKYYYESGISATMRDHLKVIVDEITEDIKPGKNMTWIDIGSNDNTLLKSVNPDLFPRRFGFEPSQLAESEQGIIIYHDYFNPDKLKGDIVPHIRADVITCIAMFYYLDDPGKFLEDIKKVLRPDGYLVLEMNSLSAMIKYNRIDNIAAERLCYYSVRTLTSLLNDHGFQVRRIETDEINGGTMRLYAMHNAKTPGNSGYTSAVLDAMTAEDFNLRELKYLQRWAMNIERVMAKLRRAIIVRVSYRRKVDAYAASTRGLTIMQLAGLDHSLIRQVVDRNEKKWGTTYNGDIPVVSEQEMRNNPPDYLLMLSQHFIAEFVAREMNLLLNGTKFILPLPEPRMLTFVKL